MSLVSLYENTFSVKFMVFTPEVIMQEIISGTWKDYIEYLRTLNKAEYNAEKKKLCGVTWSGTFKEGTRLKETLASYSGLVVIDVDKLDPEKLLLLRTQMATDKYVRFFFTSPSGNGLKIIFEVNTPKENHRAAFLHLQNYVETNYFVSVDKSGKDECRLCYVSYDPKAYVNMQSQVFEVDPKYGEVISEFKSSYEGYADSKNIESVFAVCEKWVQRNKTYRDGEKNVYIHALACALNRCGVSSEDCIALIKNGYNPPDDRWHQSVRSAYFHNQAEHGTVKVKDLSSTEFVAPNVKNFTDDVVIGDLMQTTSDLFFYKVPNDLIMDVVTKIGKYYESKGYIDLRRSNLSEMMNKAVELLRANLSAVSAQNSLPYQTADDLVEMFLNTDFASEIRTFTRIDEETGGLRLGNFYGLIGPGGTWKSMVSEYICFVNAMNGIPSLYLNGEMSQFQFYERLCSMALGIDLAKEIKSKNLNKGNVQSLINMMKEKTGGNIFFVNGSGFNEQKILSTIDNIHATTGKKVRIAFVDGVTQMSWDGREEIGATIHNSMICKEIAKKANGGEGVAVVGILHVSGHVQKWKRNTSDIVRGGQKVVANMDAYFCTSLFIDPSTNEMANDADVKYIENMFYLRYVDKRSKSPEINMAVSVGPNISMLVENVDVNTMEVKMKN